MYHKLKSWLLLWGWGLVYCYCPVLPYPYSEKEISPCFVIWPTPIASLTAEQSKTPKDLEHNHLFSIASLKFLFAHCTFHCTKSCSGTNSCLQALPTAAAHLHTEGTQQSNKQKFCFKSVVISESPFHTNAVYFPSSSFSQTMKEKPRPMTYA